MLNIIKNLQFKSIIPDSFRVQFYSEEPFRVVGLVDVTILVDNMEQCITIPFYRSSGTNDSKVQGAWYPIVGIKLHDGEFTELSEYCNTLLNRVSVKAIKNNEINAGWLIKNIFFIAPKKGLHTPYTLGKSKGYSYSRHNSFLKDLGNKLEELYENKRIIDIIDFNLNANNLNEICYKDEIIHNDNIYTQLFLFDAYVGSILLDLMEN